MRIKSLCEDAHCQEQEEVSGWPPGRCGWPLSFTRDSLGLGLMPRFRARGQASGHRVTAGGADGLVSRHSSRHQWLGCLWSVSAFHEGPFVRAVYVIAVPHEVSHRFVKLRHTATITVHDNAQVLG